jgi:hypothetical protein
MGAGERRSAPATMRVVRMAWERREKEKEERRRKKPAEAGRSW